MCQFYDRHIVSPTSLLMCYNSSIHAKLMNTQRWKVTLILDINEDSHPRKFIPESISMSLCGHEDLVDYEYERVSDDFELLYKINND